MNYVLRWAAWIVTATAASFLVGFVMRFAPGSSGGPWTVIMTLVVVCVFSMWFKKRGWW